jgi:hypothetical protein
MMLLSFVVPFAVVLMIGICDGAVVWSGAVKRMQQPFNSYYPNQSGMMNSNGQQQRHPVIIIKYLGANNLSFQYIMTKPNVVTGNGMMQQPFNSYNPNDPYNTMANSGQQQPMMANSGQQQPMMVGTQMN